MPPIVGGAPADATPRGGHEKAGPDRVAGTGLSNTCGRTEMAGKQSEGARASAPGATARARCAIDGAFRAKVKLHHADVGGTGDPDLFNSLKAARDHLLPVAIALNAALQPDHATASAAPGAAPGR